jgi:hypothetical protein
MSRENRKAKQINPAPGISVTRADADSGQGYSIVAAVSVVRIFG